MHMGVAQCYMIFNRGFAVNGDPGDINSARFLNDSADAKKGHFFPFGPSLRIKFFYSFLSFI